GNKLNASIAMPTGAHRLTVQAKDSAGLLFKQAITVNVGTAPPPPTPTPTPTPTPPPTPTPTPTPTACSPGATSPSVNICSPINGSTVTSPVHVVAAYRGSAAGSLVPGCVRWSPGGAEDAGCLQWVFASAPS